jgi:hypothetical protein
MRAAVQSQRGGDAESSLPSRDFAMILQKSQPLETGSESLSSASTGPLKISPRETTQATNLKANFGLHHLQQSYGSTRDHKKVAARQAPRRVAILNEDTHTWGRRALVYSVLRYYEIHLTKIYLHLNNIFVAFKGYVVHNAPYLHN